MTENKEILIFENTHTITNYLLKFWVDLAEQSIDLEGRFTVALHGGKTPVEFYSRLAGLKDHDIWQKTHIFLTDERFVPTENAENNFSMIKRTLLDYVSIPAGNLHPISTTYETVELAAEHFKNELIHFFHLKPNQLPEFNLMFLGIGEDGHTASLFPGQEGISDSNRLTIPTKLDYLKHDRVSLTLPVINQAQNKVFLVTGARKAHIVQEVLEKHQNFPSTQIIPKDGRLKFILDKDAASELSYNDRYMHQDQAISITNF